MAKRVISSLVGAAILFFVYFLKNDVIFNIAVVLISMIGLNEFYHAVRQINIKPIEWVGYICCLLLGLIGFVSESILLPFLVLIIPICFTLVSLIATLSDLKINFIDIACTLMGIIYVPLMFAFLILLWQMKNGYLFVWFVFGGAWLTDIFAYLVGKAIGKHKFSKTSPNKSIEGCIGGIIGSSLFYGIYSYCLNTSFLAQTNIELNIVLMTFIGAVMSVIAQIGDFSASAIKRHCKIKDFGKIMPGHGGVLDRFDSIIMIIPFVYILCEFII